MTAYNQKHIILSGTQDSERRVEEITASGLGANHCYTLLSVHKVRLNNRDSRIVKLRNPWGHAAWNGAHTYETPEAI